MDANSTTHKPKPCSEVVILSSWKTNLMSKLECAQESFEFSTGSVGNIDNDDAKCNNDAPENGNV